MMTQVFVFSKAKWGKVNLWTDPIQSRHVQGGEDE